MFDRLEKLVNVLKKTGEKVLFSDPDNFDDFYVILALKDYEKLIEKQPDVKGLTGAELVDKINRDIAVWKSQEINEGFDLNFNDFESDEEEVEDDEIIEEIIDDGFDSIAAILAQRQTEDNEIQELLEEGIEEIDLDIEDAPLSELPVREVELEKAFAEVEDITEMEEEVVESPVEEVKTEDSIKESSNWSIPKDRQTEDFKEKKDQYLEKITF